jgi:hypothetical protein
MSKKLYPIYQPGELSSGPRMGGRWVGPTGGEALRIWNGRPPRQSEYDGPRTLHISATSPNATVGSTVTIEAELANSWGGRTQRIFQIGAGLDAALRAGNFEVVNVKITSAIPANMTVFFCWSFEILDKTSLFSFLNYTGAGVATRFPEGIVAFTPESACNVTFLAPQFATTFVRAVGAGERVRTVWSAFSCNVVNRFIFEMRGL